MRALVASSVLFATLAFVSPASASVWEIDPSHSSTTFTVRHMMVTNVTGQFGKTTGTINLDDKDPTKSTIDVQIDASTIDTRDAKRDGHLKSADFFDVANHPTITFKSTKIAKAGKGKLKVTGDLSMRGVTKPVVLTVEGPTPAIKNLGGVLVRGAKATGKINRKDWGLNWNKALEAGGMLVGEDVTLNIDVELAQKDATAAAK